MLLWIGEFLFESLDCLQVGINEGEIAIGGLHSSHLGVELVKVQEEELDVDWLSVGLVAKHAHKDLEDFDQVLWTFLREDFVHGVNNLLGHTDLVSLSSVFLDLRLGV